MSSRMRVYATRHPIDGTVPVPCDIRIEEGSYPIGGSQIIVDALVPRNSVEITMIDLYARGTDAIKDALEIIARGHRRWGPLETLTAEHWRDGEE